MSREKWREQHARMKRWYERIENPSQSGEGFDTHLFRDDVIVFFMNCYHLKDWVKHDDSIDCNPDKDGFIEYSKSMKICGDLCNGAKHLDLHSPKIEEEDPEFQEGTDVTLNIGGGESGIQAEVTIETESREIDSKQFAQKCINKWDIYLSVCPDLTEEHWNILEVLRQNPGLYLRQIHEALVDLDDSRFQSSPEFGDGWNHERREIQELKKVLY